MTGSCPDWYPALKEAQAVADCLRCSVPDLKRISGESYERALLAARADGMIEAQRAKERKRNQGR